MVELTKRNDPNSEVGVHEPPGAAQKGLLLFMLAVLLLQVVRLAFEPYEGVNSLTGPGLSTAVLAIACRPFIRHRAGLIVLVVAYLAGMSVAVLGMRAN